MTILLKHQKILCIKTLLVMVIRYTILKEIIILCQEGFSQNLDV